MGFFQIPVESPLDSLASTCHNVCVENQSPFPFSHTEPTVGFQQNALTQLAHLLHFEEADIDLGQAALVIAAAHYPGLDIKRYLARLDALANEIGSRIEYLRHPATILDTLNTFLFTEQQFYGNRKDYYNPANSFLNEVLDTKGGLPISLSVLYLAMAYRLHLPIFGVGLPLHFIVKYQTEDTEILIDPFHQGEILTPDACQARVESIVRQPVVFHTSYLNVTPKRTILYRLLNNLKQVYLRREQPNAAGRVIEQMLVVHPHSDEDVRDRGILHLQSRSYTEAIDWLSRYLTRVPAAPDKDHIHDLMQVASERRALRN